MAAPRFSGPTDPRTAALIGLAGAVLSGIGDVLILGRPRSGLDFDRAVDMIPPHIVADPRWRSLWNGATLAPRRIHLGTVTGLVGIGVLQGLGLRGIARTVTTGRLRSLSTASATAFAASGVLTHLCCGVVILAYRRAAGTGTADRAHPAPRSATPLLAASAAATLAALAAFSGGLTVEAFRRTSAASRWTAVTPFPCVLATLLTFGALPAPVAGYLRPASMSIGLLAYFGVAAASVDR
ncbi:MAG: DUF6796 family protein [Propionibacteriaceae bacterium]